MADRAAATRRAARAGKATARGNTKAKPPAKRALAKTKTKAKVKPKAKVTAKAKPKAKVTAKPPTKRAKAKPRPGAKRAAAQPRPSRARKQVVLLAGGNPQIAKGDGDAPVRAYIAALPGWKRDVAARVDAVIARTVPRVRKAVKWNSPFYGVDGKGWFLSFHAFTRYLKVTFFRGASLRPVPPGTSKHADVRYLDLYEGALDEQQLAAWVEQAAALPGWMS